MKEPYLEVTFRHGEPIAAYYYLPRGANQRSARSRRVEPGLVIDFGADGQAIGIEITTPTKVSLAALNAVLRELGHAPASPADLAPAREGLFVSCATFGQHHPENGSRISLKRPNTKTADLDSL